METADTRDVTALVQASIGGDEDAWNELVRRYAGLIALVIRRHRLSAEDASDISQLVWLHLLEHLPHIRVPAALPGWLVTTTRHECQRYVRTSRRSVAVDPLVMTQVSAADQDVDEALLAAERHQVLRDGLAELPPQQRRLLTLLAADPPHSYLEISRVLHIPVGSIGPTRRRALEKLRETSAVQTFLRANQEAAWKGGARHVLS